MSVLPLCVVPHPVLRVPAQRVESFTHELRRMAADLIDTMYANDGVGLAASQVGWSLQLFVANPSQRVGQELVIVNPVVEPAGGRAAIVEGCLSVPKAWHKVRRAARVHVRGQDLSGRPLTLEAEGLLAIVLQHEADHLEGRLFVDRLSWLQRRRLLKRVP